MTDLHVIFGTGPLGRSTMQALLNKGMRVQMVNRSGQMADLPQGVTVVKGDAYDPDVVYNLVKDATSVYQCAQPPYYEWAEKFPPLQASILMGTAKAGAKLVLGDNLYMYGDPQGRAITEQSPINPQTRKGKVRAHMAQTALDAHANGVVRVAIGRASDFFGPYDEVQGGTVYRPAIAGKSANAIGNPDMLHSFTYIKDFGCLLATLGTDDRADGGVWFAPCLPPITQRDLISKIFAEIGTPMKMRVGTRLILRVMGLFDKTVRELVEMLYEFEKPFIVDTTHTDSIFGLQATPLDVAIRETVAYFKANPGDE